VIVCPKSSKTGEENRNHRSTPGLSWRGCDRSRKQKWAALLSLSTLFFCFLVFLLSDREEFYQSKNGNVTYDTTEKLVRMIIADNSLLESMCAVCVRRLRRGFLTPCNHPVSLQRVLPFLLKFGSFEPKTVHLKLSTGLPLARTIKAPNHHTTQA